MAAVVCSPSEPAQLIHKLLPPPTCRSLFRGALSIHTKAELELLPLFVTLANADAFNNQ